MLFDLRHEIRRKLQEGHDPRPAAIADTLAQECPDEYLRLGLSQALPYLVRDEIRKVRHQVLGRADRSVGEDAADAITKAKLDPKAAPGSAGRPETSATRPGGSSAFTVFDVPISVGRARWKRLGDCTREDIEIAVSLLKRRAAENQARADAFARLLRTMSRRRVETVGDLDPAKVRDLVQPALEEVAGRRSRAASSST